MRLLVDYTNWNGRRAWREIEPWNGEFKIEQAREGSPHGGHWVMHVAMVDKGGARRSLQLTNIHRFHEARDGKIPATAGSGGLPPGVVHP